MKTIKPMSVGETFSNKTNDCAVRAFSNATGIDYVAVEEYFDQLGRKENEGTSLKVIVESFDVFTPKKIMVFGTTISANTFYVALKKKQIDFDVKAGCSLEKFVATYNKGKYVVVYRGHALCVIDGKIVDKAASLANKYVCAAFQF